MTGRTTEEQAVERRKAILSAARWCFLNFGFAKTSLDDIAKRANISRPLIYRTFKNKEDIFAGVLEDWFEARFPLAEEVAVGRGTKAEKLTRVCEILLLEPWSEMVSGPMGAEFYDVCERLVPQVEAKHQRRVLKVVQAILGAKDLAEVFLLAVDGLGGDLPATPALRRRLQLFIERFVD